MHGAVNIADCYKSPIIEQLKKFTRFLVNMNITRHFGKTISATILAAGLYACSNGVQPSQKLQDRIVSNVETTGQVNYPKVLVIDCFEKKVVPINNDSDLDVSHGEVVSKILEEKLPNADIYKRNVESLLSSNISANLDTLFSGILKRNEKFDAINMSLGVDISFNKLSELLGFEITSKNVANLKDRIRDSLANSKYNFENESLACIAENLNKMDLITANGSKIYVAAGNYGENVFNLYSLANGIDVVGGFDWFENLKNDFAKNSLITRYELAEFPIEKLDDGFDITFDDKTDFKFGEMANSYNATKEPFVDGLVGTSFAAPSAIIKDLEVRYD